MVVSSDLDASPPRIFVIMELTAKLVILDKEYYVSRTVTDPNDVTKKLEEIRQETTEIIMRDAPKPNKIRVTEDSGILYINY